MTRKDPKDKFRNAIFFNVDMQRCYEPYFWPNKGWAFLQANTSLLVDRFAAHNVPTVHVGYADDFLPFDNGVGLYKETPEENRKYMQDELGAQFTRPMKPNDYVAYKNVRSLGKEEAILNYISERDISTIYLSGIAEMASLANFRNCCVSLSADDLTGLGYDVVIVAEATNLGLKSTMNYLPLKTRKRLHKMTGADVMRMRDIFPELKSSCLRPISQKIASYIKCHL